MRSSRPPSIPRARRCGPLALWSPARALGIALALAAPPARAQEARETGPLGPQARAHGQDPGPPLAAWVDLAAALDERPLFRLARQDRAGLGLEVQSTAHPALTLWGSTRLSWTRSEAGRSRGGSEGLLLGARLRPLLLTQPPSGVLPGLFVEGRLPLDRAVDGVASRAADAILGGELTLAVPSAWAWRLRAGAALEILGDPTRPAEQDDRLLASFGLALAPGPLGLSLHGELAPSSPRNLGGARLVGRVQAGTRWPLGLELSTGAGSAARLGLRLWTGAACLPSVGD